MIIKDVVIKKFHLKKVTGLLFEVNYQQGSLIKPSSKTDSSNNKLGYIPDKYVALRSSKRYALFNSYFTYFEIYLS